MRHEMFQDCCGIGVTSGFYKGPVFVEPELRTGISIHINANRGRILVTLSNSQRPTYERLLKHYRFRRVDGFNNPNSGNHVSVYSLAVSRKYKFPVPMFKVPEDEEQTPQPAI